MIRLLTACLALVACSAAILAQSRSAHAYYVTDAQVIDQGDCVPQLVGSFACEVSGTALNSTTTETRSGSFCSYKDRGPDGLTAESALRRLPTGLILQQSKVQGVITYQFVELNGNDRANIFVASMEAVNALLQQQGVKAEPAASPPFVRLVGPKAKLLAVLLAHDKPHLTLLGSCRRTK